ncbi:MAG: methyltransferase family protein [Candidatus Hadarchaeum sp.]|uniref:methyltransferase family protein n=1 Tax=Candidatus Hadarchaeum sp. TaxID=2883567 RepID=UPI003D0C1EF6
MRKTIALIAIFILIASLEVWIWLCVAHPLLPMFVVALAGAGALGLLWRSWALTWAGISAAWAFYLPVLLALLQVSIGMALIYGGLLAFLYGIWAPLLSFEATAWLVRGRISEPQPFQFVAPVLIVIGSALFAVALAQLVRSKVRGGGLVTCGLYALVRHPQYLGVNILALGFVLYGLRPIDFIAWVNLVFLHAALAESEEGRLRSSFGEKYLEYQSQVPFLIPFLPQRLRRSLGGRLASGRRRKVVLVVAYLLTMALLIALLWSLWQANGAMLMR